jgi:hypothetical protein
MESLWRNCFKCDYQAVTPNLNCPRCRKSRLRSAGEIRLLGVLLAILGVIGTLMISAAGLFYASMAFIPEKSGSSVKFTGSKTDVATAFGFIVVTLTLCLSSTGAGIWQMIFGRRNRILLWISVVVGLGLLMFGELILAISQRL